MSAQMSTKAPSGYKKGAFANFTPEQTQLFSQMFSNVSPESYLGKMASGDESQFEQMEKPALRQFGQLQGNIASRFSGMGMGARRSSGFQNTMSQAGSDLAERLSSQRMGLRNQAIQELMSMGNQLLGQRPYEQFLVKKQQGPSAGQRMLGGAMTGLGAVGGGMFGGPQGAAMGAQFGSAFGSGFTGGDMPQMNFSGMSDLPTTWGI